MMIVGSVIFVGFNVARSSERESHVRKLDTTSLVNRLQCSPLLGTGITPNTDPNAARIAGLQCSPLLGTGITSPGLSLIGQNRSASM